MQALVVVFQRNSRTIVECGDTSAYLLLCIKLLILSGRGITVYEKAGLRKSFIPNSVLSARHEMQSGIALISTVVGTLVPVFCYLACTNTCKYFG